MCKQARRTIRRDGCKFGAFGSLQSNRYSNEHRRHDVGQIPSPRSFRNLRSFGGAGGILRYSNWRIHAAVARIYRFVVCARSHPPIYALRKTRPRPSPRRSLSRHDLSWTITELAEKKPIHNATTRRIKARLVSRLSESPLSSLSHPVHEHERLSSG